jgi:NADH-quinone oxidoreductase subunit N
VGLEILSVSAYALIAFRKTERACEAGLKYLVLASVASSFLLFGIALIYLQSGTLELEALSKLQGAEGSPGATLYLAAGAALVFVGIAFKIAVVPFHMWAPDVYQGAPAPVAGFIATVSKGAVFAFALRYLAVATLHDYGRLSLVVSLIAIASMFVGNLLALLQTNVKRLLAYSSISHAGYVLVAFEASGALALQAVGYYLAVYFAAILGAFGVISLLSSEQAEAEELSVYEGLAARHPFLAGLFTLMLFSLAGIPLTAGFIGEFYVLSAGVSSRLWTLVLALVISSVIGLFYYLRVILALYRTPSPSTPAPSGSVLSYPGSIVLSLLALFVLVLGVFPSPLIRIIASSLAIP